MGDTIIKIDQTWVITPDTIAKLLKEGKDKWTKEEFAKNMEWLSSDVQKKILDAIPKEEDKFYKKKP
jgi:hypothetical protein